MQNRNQLIKLSRTNNYIGGQSKFDSHVKYF